MEVGKIVETLLNEYGGLHCRICNQWDDKDRFVGPICGDCNKEIEDVIAEAEDW